jgi:DNA-binding MarR family transcriptional regulator
VNDELLQDERVTLWGLLLEVHAAIQRRLVHDLEVETGLPGHWFEVLLRIGRTPGQAVPMTQLAGMVSFSSGGFTKLADRMERAGLIRRAPCPTDRRSTLATLTEDGRRALHQALAVHLPGLQRHLIDSLDDRQRSELEQILRTLRTKLEAERTRSSLPLPLGEGRVRASPEGNLAASPHPSPRPAGEGARRIHLGGSGSRGVRRGSVHD